MTNDTQFKDMLRKAGFKATLGRVAVLELLSKNKKPLSIKDIQEKLKGEKLDQATLYRMMSALEEVGILRATDFGHGHAHYELETKDHHHHLTCQRCGKIVDISACDTHDLEKQALKIGRFSTITKHSLELFGICQACTKK